MCNQPLKFCFCWITNFRFSPYFRLPDRCYQHQSTFCRYSFDKRAYLAITSRCSKFSTVIRSAGNNNYDYLCSLSCSGLVSYSMKKAGRAEQTRLYLIFSTSVRSFSLTSIAKIRAGWSDIYQEYKPDSVTWKLIGKSLFAAGKASSLSCISSYIDVQSRVQLYIPCPRTGHKFKYPNSVYKAQIISKSRIWYILGLFIIFLRRSARQPLPEGYITQVSVFSQLFKI